MQAAQKAAGPAQGTPQPRATQRTPASARDGAARSTVETGIAVVQAKLQALGLGVILFGAGEPENSCTLASVLEEKDHLLMPAGVHSAATTLCDAMLDTISEVPQPARGSIIWFE